MATWRALSSANKRYNVATRPNLEWVMSAVKDPDCVVVFNVCWYDWDEEEQSYRREVGHWITVVAQGTSKNQFHVHNRSLAPDVQVERVLIRLKAVDNNFSVS